jgi:hypothetical protein
MGDEERYTVDLVEISNPHSQKMRINVTKTADCFITKLGTKYDIVSGWHKRPVGKWSAVGGAPFYKINLESLERI